ncbi:nucleotidyltransferase domain-containing protein [Sandarakinorhabdus sp. AAP62]|uniref:nucleotidyltransferase domain-containing protein n=1 Tax=Sandarakinorhabdus sp. AAP62 TaxID=1248916 RepID=UPI0002F4FA7E|nr:nucleotidyltransferase domain-containing protein [Sandarakinorhabdus sp. AAP62]
MGTALSREQDALISDVSAGLARITGVAAVVLGGSHARGRARPDSDIDIALYYRQRQPFAISAIRDLAARCNDTPEPVVSGFGEWGRWVDGGAWLTVGGQRVDLLYRQIDMVEHTLAEALCGRFEVDFAQQPPFGFFGPTVLGEVAIAKALFDPAGLVAELKTKVMPMPDALRRAVVQQCLWSVDFGLRAFAPKFVAAGNVYGAVGCFTRFANALALSLFALNGVYLLNDKTAMTEISEFPLTVPDFSDRLSTVLGTAGTEPLQLGQSMADMAKLFEATATLAGDLYRPTWNF